MKKRNRKREEWTGARERHHLSDIQVQMARELGMNPAKLGKLDNSKQEPWKMPPGPYIEHLYRKRFEKAYPDNVTSIKERSGLSEEKREARHRSRQQLLRGTP
ncbi:MAG TPA: hypothetical protein VHS97_18700 [Isosphaeraceae bacterium]|jgi:hypothetical protein|nr:hypothetical protein [Isosphaeraceae bacterium]